MELVAGWSVSLAIVLTAALALVLVRILLTLVQTWQTAQLTSEVIATIRKELASAFLRASWPAQAKVHSGRLQELLTTFAQQGSTLISNVAMMIVSGFSLLAMTASAVALDPFASLVLVVAVALLATLLRPLRSAIRSHARSTAESGMDFATALNEISSIGMEVSVFGVQQQTDERVQKLIVINQATARKLKFLQGLIPAVYTGMAYMAIVAALGVASSFDRSNLGSIGAVMLVMLRSLSYGQSVQSASAAINGSLSFLQTLEDELDYFRNAAGQVGEVAPGEVGCLEARGVDFEYVSGSPVLRGITFKVNSNEVIGMIGASGGGKSTLVQLMLGLREPTRGQIVSGGVDLTRVEMEEWRLAVAFVPQEAHLIRGSVADNITFMRSGVSRADIERAARLANLHDDILTWDGGYDREVGDQGKNLSGGQKQRVTIARALLMKPELLILDEPTSALDVHSEAAIRNSLERLRKHMTVIIVAHRLSTLELCDRIMVMKDGELTHFDVPALLEGNSDFYDEALAVSGIRRS